MSSSSPSSSRQPSFVGQDVFHDAANQLQKKPSTSPPALTSSPAATVLDASTSGDAPEKQGTNSHLMCSTPKPSTVNNVSPSPGVPVPSPGPSPTLTSSTTPASPTMHCKHPGCSRSAKYREEKGTPPIACQAHKRKGQYTINRKGELLVATRDGEAFRTSELETPVATAVASGSSPASRDSNGTAAASSSPRPSTGSSGSKGKPSAPSRRKQVAKLSAPARMFKGPKRPGLSSKADGGHESCDRPCLFPGCDAQPGYGLPGAARAVYCLSHKKGSMVHIFEKPLDANPHGLKRKAAAATAEVKTKDNNTKTVKDEGKLQPTATITAATTASTLENSDKDTKNRWHKPKVEEAVGADGGGGGAERGIETSRVEGATMTGEVKPQERIHHNTESSSSSEISTAARAAAGVQAPTTATVNHSTQGPATATTPPPPPATNRMADTSGMAPSVEMLLQRQAREAAKEEARASGRRPRAPSRRALEASGKMQGEGAQWMTREKKAEQARAAAELREQRRLYKEAGLRFGVVVETLVEPATAASGEGDKAGGGGSGGAEAVRSDPDWQKFPAALLVAAPQLQSIIRDEGARPEKRAKPNSPDTNA